ncbi:MAG: CoA pyrophosphatase [Microlunatus sp.]|nr:CoA pyrophosphatase [Microlunatus sp.]MDN5770587.1 CoA pyrophosphatase [Microlunatus sp.]MDN5803482.1 CoA pyrophosphatase [Microlunatus sp.]
MSSLSELPDWLGPLDAALLDSERLRQAVALRPGVGGRAAAVLVLIGSGRSGPEILFVERAATLRTHAGQIAFPGGANDPGDTDLIATAVREAHEETAVDPSGIEPIGALPPAHVAVSGFDVTTVVGWWRESSPVRPADPGEVASVHVVPVAELTAPAHRGLVRHPSGYIGPGFEVAGHLIWGLTAHLLDGVLDLAGWQREWDRTRRIEIPARYLTDLRTGGGHDAH